VVAASAVVDSAAGGSGPVAGAGVVRRGDNAVVVILAEASAAAVAAAMDAVAAEMVVAMATLAAALAAGADSAVAVDVGSAGRGVTLPDRWILQNDGQTSLRTKVSLQIQARSRQRSVKSTIGAIVGPRSGVYWRDTGQGRRIRPKAVSEPLLSYRHH